MSQISKTNFRHRLALALALPLVLMSLLAVILIGQISHLTSVMQWVEHTDQVIAQANYTQKLLVDMETGLRCYLVMGGGGGRGAGGGAGGGGAPAGGRGGRGGAGGPPRRRRRK